MNQKIRELRDKRAGIVTQQRDLLNKAEAEKREELTTDEQQTYDALDKDFEVQTRAIEREERLFARESEMRQSVNPEIPRGNPGGENRGNGANEKHMVAFRNYLMRGPMGINGDDVREIRAHQADADVSGGALVMPMQMVDMLIQAIDNQVIIRQLATKFTLTQAASLGVPTLDSDVDDAEWTAELKTGSETSDMTFGKRELKPHPLAKRLKVSNTLLRLSSKPLEQLITQRLGYKIGVTQEKGYMTGSGHNQPLGIFTASDDGVPTSRDVQPSGEVTATAFKGDAFISLKAAIPQTYWPRLRCVISRTGWSMARKLKDSTGNYIWGMGLQGQPDTIVDVPMIVSEYCPSTFTAGLYVAAMFDPQQYWIVDALNPQIQRLNELYAETNQVGFISRYEGDGMPVLAEAFARLKLAAS